MPVREVAPAAAWDTIAAPPSVAPAGPTGRAAARPQPPYPPPRMLDPASLAVVCLVFLLAGWAKGVVGFGLPTIALGLLAAVYDLQVAVALQIVPAMVTNLWQAAVGGHFLAIVRRIWPLLAACSVAILLSASVLARADGVVLGAVLGVTLWAYAAVGLAVQVPGPGRHEPWVTPLVGAASGVLGGVTGSFVVPCGPYLQAIGMPRDMLVQALGVCFGLFALVLGIAMRGHGLFPDSLGLVSAIGVLPALAGMALGRRLRGRLSEARFRRVFFLALLALGVYLVGRLFA